MTDTIDGIERLIVDRGSNAQKPLERQWCDTLFHPYLDKQVKRCIKLKDHTGPHSIDQTEVYERD